MILPSYVGIIINRYKDPDYLLNNQYFMERVSSYNLGVDCAHL